MRDLIVTENMTVDGVIAPIQGWFDPGAQDDELLAVSAEHRRTADALLLGRVTYEEFAEYWPAQTGDTTGITEYLNKVTKYVASAHLEQADWPNTSILRGPVEDEVAALKRESGGDIVMTGSATLVHALLPTGLIDVVRLFVYPVVQGHGRRMFPNAWKADLSLAETRTFRSGVVLLAYRRTA